MNRYQIYLDPQSVATFDRLALQLDLTRSKIIRDAIDRLALEYEKLLVSATGFKTSDNPLLRMSGIIKGASKNLSEDVDSIYPQD